MQSLPLPLLAALLGSAAFPPQQSQPLAGTPLELALPSSIHWQDFDCDGRLDAYAVTRGGRNRLLRNESSGAFEDVTERVGLAGVDAARVVAWADADGDGWVDLACVTAGRLRLLRNVDGRTFADMSETMAVETSDAVQSLQWLDLDGDDLPELHVDSAGACALYRNLGRLQFERVELAASFPVALDPAFEAPHSTTGSDSPPASLDHTGLTPPVDWENSSGTLGQPSSPQMVGTRCPQQLKDVVTLNCIGVSTVPTLGMLYPLGPELNVDATGKVGIGTITPGDKLEIAGGGIKLGGSYGIAFHRAPDGNLGLRVGIGTQGNTVRFYEAGNPRSDILADSTGTHWDILGGTLDITQGGQVRHSFAGTSGKASFGLTSGVGIGAEPNGDFFGVYKETQWSNAPGGYRVRLHSASGALEFANSATSPGLYFVGEGNAAFDTNQAIAVRNSANVDTITLRRDGAMYIGGDVGIGTSSPAAKLDVAGTTETDALRVPTGATSGHVLTSDGAGNATWQAPTGGVGGSGTVNRIAQFSAGNQVGDSAIVQDSAGQVAINTTPTSFVKFDVQTTTSMSGIRGVSSGGVGVTAWSTSGWGLNASSTSSDGVRANSSTADGVRATSTSGDGVDASSSSGTGVRGAATGASGVNYGVWGSTASPSGYGVYSNGPMKATGAFDAPSVTAGTLRVTTTPTAGHVLTSDATGNATWQPPTGGGIGGSGTVDTLSRFTASGMIGDSVVVQSAAGEIGIGTATPGGKLGVDSGLLQSALKATSPHTNARAIRGWSTATTGSGIGVYGVTFSTDPAPAFYPVGIAGSTDTTEHAGFGIGAWGQSYADSGYGVVGLQAHTSGDGSGVFGQSYSPDGIGVQGQALATTGVNRGVYGFSNSPDGYGVEGYGSSLTGASVGVVGRSISSLGRGVEGHASNTSGVTYGVRGISDSNSGRGVEGHASSATGTTYGVRGTTSSSTGRGVSGRAFATTGVNYGVLGQSDSTDGRGVHGVAAATTGANYGVQGQSESTSGLGVFGLATATSGNTKGVQGESASNEGIGVIGFATDATTDGLGTSTVGVHGESLGEAGLGVVGHATQPQWIGFAQYPVTGVYGQAHDRVGGLTQGSAGVHGVSTASQVVDSANNLGGFEHYGVVGEATSTPWYGDDVHHVGVGGFASYAPGPPHSLDQVTGVYGQADSVVGRGVLGIATETSGINAIGVQGQTYSPEGQGMAGFATSTSGTGAGLYGQTNSKDGFGVYSNGDVYINGFWNNTDSDAAALTIRAYDDASGLQRGIRIWGNTGTYDYGGQINFGNGDYVYLREDLDDHLMIGGKTRFQNRVTIYGTTTSTIYELDVGGDIRCNSVTQTSDERLKHSVADLDGALAKIEALRGVSFEWDLDARPSASAGRQLGFLAQEVRAVVPEAVVEAEDGYLAVSYTSLVPLLVEALQEQQREIDALRAQVHSFGGSSTATAASAQPLESFRQPVEVVSQPANADQDLAREVAELRRMLAALEARVPKVQPTVPTEIGQVRSGTPPQSERAAHAPELPKSSALSAKELAARALAKNGPSAMPRRLDPPRRPTLPKVEPQSADEGEVPAEQPAIGPASAGDRSRERSSEARRPAPIVPIGG